MVISVCGTCREVSDRAVRWTHSHFPLTPAFPGMMGSATELQRIRSIGEEVGFLRVTRDFSQPEPDSEEFATGWGGP